MSALISRLPSPLPFVQLLFLLAAFVLSRWLWLVVAPGSAGYWEESFRWVAANELLHQPYHPFLEYQPDHYQGGPLVMTALTVEMMKVFGQTPLVLKMISVGVGATTLVLLFWLARLAFGPTAALVAGLYYLVGPPQVAAWSLVQLGSHAESLIFSLGLALAFTTMARAEALRPLPCLFTGLLAGVGIWFCYSTGLMVLACLLAWLLLRPLPARRELGFGGTGLVVGLLPWVYYNSQTGWRGLNRIAEVFGSRAASDFWPPQTVSEKLWALVTHDFPYGIMLNESDQALTHWIVAAFCLPLAFATVVSLLRSLVFLYQRGARGRREPVPTAGACMVLVTMHTLVVGTFMALSSFTITGVDPVQLRMLTPWAVLLALPFGALIADLYENWTKVARVLLVSVCLASGFGTLAYITANRDVPSSLASRNGYTVQGLLTFQKYRDDMPQVLEVGRRIDDAYLQRRFFFGVGWGMAMRLGSADPNRALHLMWLVRNTAPAVHAPVLAGLVWAGPTIASRLSKWGDIPQWSGWAEERVTPLENAIALSRVVFNAIPVAVRRAPGVKVTPDPNFPDDD